LNVTPLTRTSSEFWMSARRGRSTSRFFVSGFALRRAQNSSQNGAPLPSSTPEPLMRRWSVWSALTSAGSHPSKCPSMRVRIFG
jgi:hypothetical protein